MTRKEIQAQIKSLTELLEKTPYDETDSDQVEKYLIDRGFSPERYDNEEWFEKTVQSQTRSKITLSVNISEFNPQPCYILTDNESGKEIEQCGFRTLAELFEKLQNFPSYGQYEITPKVDRIIVWRSLDKTVDFKHDEDIESFDLVDTVDFVNGDSV